MKNNKILEEEWAHDVHLEMKQRAELLKKAINWYGGIVEKSPKGYLRVMKHRDKYQYFHRLDPNDTKGVYIPKNNYKLAQALAQRDYYQKLIREAKEELAEIESFLSKIKPTHIDGIYQNLSEGRKELVIPVIEPEEQLRDRWDKEEYEKKEITIENYVTLKGERVRSKSELIIANMLYEYNIPYQYEYPLIVGGIIFHPDFRVINVKTRKIKVWEHFGMMDDLSYARNNVEKIEKYENAGYMLGDNLIATFETSKNSINTKTIRRNIEKHLL